MFKISCVTSGFIVAPPFESYHISDYAKYCVILARFFEKILCLADDKSCSSGLKVVQLNSYEDARIVFILNLNVKILVGKAIGQ